VDDDIAVVLHDPFTPFVSLDRQALLALSAHHCVDFLGKDVQLTPAGTRDENEVVVEWSLAPHVEDENIAGLMVRGEAGTETGVVESDAPRGGRQTSHGGGIQETSFRLGGSWQEVVQATVSDLWVLLDGFVAATSRPDTPAPCSGSDKKPRIVGGEFPR